MRSMPAGMLRWILEGKKPGRRAAGEGWRVGPMLGTHKPSVNLRLASGCQALARLVRTAASVNSFKAVHKARTGAGDGSLAPPPHHSSAMASRLRA